MPTYEYACPQGHEFELFQKMSDKPRTKCPVCGKMAVRKISAGAGLHFKGSGFYITDYGKDGKGPRKEAASGDAGKATPAAKEGGESSAAPKPAPAPPAKAEKAPGRKAKP